jgi:hypothetical protein
MRVLRYLPTNLSAPDIARELSVSVTTAVISLSSCRAKYPCITAYFPADK